MVSSPLHPHPSAVGLSMHTAGKNKDKTEGILQRHRKTYRLGHQPNDLLFLHLLCASPISKFLLLPLRCMIIHWRKNKGRFKNSLKSTQSFPKSSRKIGWNPCFDEFHEFKLVAFKFIERILTLLRYHKRAFLFVCLFLPGMLFNCCMWKCILVESIPELRAKCPRSAQLPHNQHFSSCKCPAEPLKPQPFL